MIKTLTLLIIPILILGCSYSNGMSVPDFKGYADASESQDNHWSWGVWEFRFNEDHSKLDVIPFRGAQYHYCVTKLMEEYPCSNCLSIGQPKVQPDGTIKFNVTLRHPFPSSPKYTGFDVRGMVYFPPTSIHDKIGGMDYENYIYYGDHGKVLLSSMPFNWSRADEGGGELLNPDGYSCYMIPWLTYSKYWPIFSYSQPKYGIGPTPQGTINPYRLFASDNDRRMFLVSDVIKREYHVALPPGPINFGYAVDACWWPPDKTPVTDPAHDFPLLANAEDPWLIEYEQILPIKKENLNKAVFKVTVHDRGGHPGWDAKIWGWGLAKDCFPEEYHPQFYAAMGEKVDDSTYTGTGALGLGWWKDCIDVVNPGHHLGVMVVYRSTDDDPIPKTTELRFVYGIRFIDIYIE